MVNESGTMVQCPRCIDGMDPTEVTMRSATVCCGNTTRGECGGENCTGPETINDPEPVACVLCLGNRFVSESEALGYCLECG